MLMISSLLERIYQRFKAVKEYLHKQFKIKDLGELRYFLGLEIARSREGIAINQRKYCVQLLTDTGVLEAKRE